MYGLEVSAISVYQNKLVTSGWTLIDDDQYIDANKTAIITVIDELTTFKTITIKIQKITTFPTEKATQIIGVPFVSFDTYDYAFIIEESETEILFRLYGVDASSFLTLSDQLSLNGWIKNDFLDIYTLGEFNLYLYNYTSQNGTLDVTLSNLDYYGDYFDTWTKTGLSAYTVEPLHNEGFEYFVYHGRLYGYTQGAAILMYGSDITDIESYHQQLIDAGYALNENGWYEHTESNYLVKAEEDMGMAVILIIKK